MVRAYYINGLGDGVPRVYVTRAVSALSSKGVSIEHIPVDWYSDETFDAATGRIVSICTSDVAAGHRVVLVGLSAGGSLAVHVLRSMQSTEVSVITMCSRLNDDALPWYDWRTLERMAHITSGRPSFLFRDAVERLTDEVIPTLSVEQKARITTFVDMCDEVVPVKTMGIPGVKRLRVNSIGHTMSIKRGLKHIAPYLA